MPNWEDNFVETDVALTPVLEQYVKIKSEHKNEILFFRVGDFYEMFFDDAGEVSRLLNLTLTHKGAAPMCGIPYHAAKIYIARLLRAGRKVVICEQIGDPKAKGLTERKVVEIITPGTALESEYLEGNSNNFLAALAVTHGGVGLRLLMLQLPHFPLQAGIQMKWRNSFRKNWDAVRPGKFFCRNRLSRTR